MMEKRNFVTSVRTPMDGASDIDGILDAGAQVFKKARREKSEFQKKASAEDERTDTLDGAAE